MSVTHTEDEMARNQVGGGVGGHLATYHIISRHLLDGAGKQARGTLTFSTLAADSSSRRSGWSVRVALQVGWT